MSGANPYGVNAAGPYGANAAGPADLTAPETVQALANMSAPPRSRVTVQPFRVPREDGAASGPHKLANWGLAWFSRVDFDANLRTCWPGWAPEGGSARRSAHLRLCGAVALVRGRIHPRDLERELGEDLGDELLRLAPVLASTLPPLLMATRAAEPTRPLEADPLRALALLTHLSGRTCDPAGPPLLSEALLEGHALDLWTPEATHV